MKSLLCNSIRLLTIEIILLSLAETSKTSSIEINPRPLVFRTTSEGIGAIFYKVVYVAKALQDERNFTVITLPSPHYNHEQLSICRYFDVPESIQCADSSDVHDCSRLNATVMLLTENCIDGPTPTSIRRLPNFRKTSWYSLGIAFNDFSHSLQRLALDALKIELKRTFVFHWRRGDALHSPTMCASREVKSLNCLGVADLIEDIQTKANNRTIYIATNEQNSTIMDELASLGFHTSYSLVGLLEQAGIKLSLSDLIVVDLLLMCKAEEFFYYGKSSLDRLAMQCRVSLEQSMYPQVL